MDLATPAPIVGPATVENAPLVEPATVTPVQPKHPATAEPATHVEPATAEPAMMDTDQLIKQQPSHGSTIPCMPCQHSHAYHPTNGVATNGASVNTLRGGRGADFEGYCGILRAAAKHSLIQLLGNCCMKERDFVAYGEVRRFALLKDTFCFVFEDEDGTSPLYAIPMSNLSAVVEDESDPHPSSNTISPSGVSHGPVGAYETVLLFKDGNKLEYQFTFDVRKDGGMAKRFANAVQNYNKNGEGQHQGGGLQTASAIHAKNVFASKAKYQPEDPNE
eukprot:CAMPEP_0195527242 /NCGR_PEP_ID=MMETSP0794_2-20130614/28773_1 /TAXON_ID=515487 /ORGANISM="Stephanopyxis turris, Strain CCMP 815" /LENGTH=275 /DNA_ID=CAMNT_0040658109 /DNA_START=110 /DNA_END=937 /DNA_ORIENTATION=-